MKERFGKAVRVEPLGGVRDGAAAAAPGEISGAGGGTVAAGGVGGEVEECAPGGGVAPARVGAEENGVHVGLKRETSVLSEGRIRDGAREVSLGGGRQRWGDAGGGNQLRVQGEEFGVAARDGQGAQRQGEGDVVEGVRFPGGSGEGGGGDGESERHGGRGGGGGAEGGRCGDGPVVVVAEGG